MAVVDIATFVADLKDLSADHGFHVHDERHFVETYSMRQAWEIDLHPAYACGGPLDLHIAVEVDPRTMLSFEDLMTEVGETEDPPDEHHLPVIISWALPPLLHGPDLLVLATDLAGLGGTDLPLEVTAMDAFADVIDAPERSVNIVSRLQASLARIYLGQEDLGPLLPKAAEVSEFLLDRAPAWLGEI